MDISRKSILKSDCLYSLQLKMENLYIVSQNKTGSWLVLWRSIRTSRTNTKKKDVLFIIGDWNAKVGSQEIQRIIGKFWFSGVQNEARQRIKFCQENTLVTANTLFQQHKRRLYTWTSPDGQYQNHIDCIFCSWRWRSSIQSAKKKNGLWLRTWASYCKIQAQTEQSRENH